MTEHITMTRLEIHSFQRVRVGVWDLTPGLQQLTSNGLNKQGKTSVLRAIRTLFEGAGASPKEPLNKDDDGDEAWVRAVLSNGWTIMRKFTHANPKGYLSVVNPDGLTGAQRNIQPWLGGRAFDPLSFWSMTMPVVSERSQFQYLSGP